jgi:hypothetical protein
MRSTTRRRLARCASVHSIQVGGKITVNWIDSLLGQYIAQRPELRAVA